MSMKDVITMQSLSELSFMNAYEEKGTLLVGVAKTGKGIELLFMSIFTLENAFDRHYPCCIANSKKTWKKKHIIGLRPGWATGVSGISILQN